ncbi:hypothetical protein WJX73_009508, partial [Symbiochloris irregularis]
MWQAERSSSCTASEAEVEREFGLYGSSTTCSPQVDSNGRLICACVSCSRWKSYLAGLHSPFRTLALRQYEVLTEELICGLAAYLRQRAREILPALGSQQALRVLEVGGGDGRLAACLRAADLEASNAAWEAAAEASLHKSATLQQEGQALLEIICTDISPARDSEQVIVLSADAALAKYSPHLPCAPARHMHTSSGGLASACTLQQSIGREETRAPFEEDMFEQQEISSISCHQICCTDRPWLPKRHSKGCLHIAATSGTELAAGLHYWLKERCSSSVSWHLTGGNQIDPACFSAASLAQREDHQALYRGRSTPYFYYQNVVTVSYSSTWWDWERWEQEIDWMALHGINLPLAFTGQEEIWRRVWRRWNLTEAEIAEHFSGPSFLAWQRMGNLRGWGGPLSDHWMLAQADLQKRILRRMRALDMTPVLPAFAGIVPRALGRVLPKANITRLSN